MRIIMELGIMVLIAASLDNRDEMLLRRKMDNVGTAVSTAILTNMKNVRKEKAPKKTIV